MKDRILEFLKAEDIGVQPSGISHILSGRNNPSLDFVLKMLEKYKLLSTDWLLFGKGSMYKGVQMQTLFDEPSDSVQESDKVPSRNEPEKSILEFQDNTPDQSNKVFTESARKRTSGVEKIVWFYNNNSFEEYFPR
jgi:transcriptional regulator with XRE-family HTH domain